MQISIIKQTENIFKEDQGQDSKLYKKYCIIYNGTIMITEIAGRMMESAAWGELDMNFELNHRSECQ